MNYKDSKSYDKIFTNNFGFDFDEDLIILSERSNYVQNTSFDKIQEVIQNKSSNPKNIEKNFIYLLRDIANVNFKYQNDFLTSGFGQYLVRSLQLENKYLSYLLDIIKYLSSYKTNSRYTCEMINLGLIESLCNLINSFQNVKSLNQKNLLNIISILDNISAVNVNFKNLIINEFPLDVILKYIIISVFSFTKIPELPIININEFPLDQILKFFIVDINKFPHAKEFVIDFMPLKFACILFCHVLPGDKSESRFGQYFPYFAIFYFMNKNLHLGEIYILKLFCLLSKINIFMDYFDDNKIFGKITIVDDIIDMIEATNDKISNLVLIFTYLIMKQKFEKCENHVNKYISKLKSDSVEVSCNAARVVRYIMKYEFDLIPPIEHLEIARHLMLKTQKGNPEQKKVFLKAFCTLTEKCGDECLREILNHSFVLYLTKFVDTEDDQILSLLLQEVDFLVDKEKKTLGTQDILNEFLDNGGMEAFQDYLANNQSDDICDQIIALMRKYDININDI